MKYEALIKSDGLELLQVLLGFTPNPLNSGLTHAETLNDVVFVSIDFENLQGIMRNPNFNENLQEIVGDLNFTSKYSAGECRSELGVAILDTRDLVSPKLKDEQVIKTYNFVTGPTKRKFIFGAAVKIEAHDMLAYLKSLIPPSRSIVLVGHGFGGDLEVLKHLGFDLGQESIIGVFDTQNIYAERFPKGTIERSMQLKLFHLLLELNCPFAPIHLHNGGNDAHFTLQALLLLAIRNYCSHTFVHCALVERIRAVAQVLLFDGEGTALVTQSEVRRKEKLRTGTEIQRAKIKRLLAKSDIRAKRAKSDMVEATRIEGLLEGKAKINAQRAIQTEVRRSKRLQLKAKINETSKVTGLTWIASKDEAAAAAESNEKAANKAAVEPAEVEMWNGTNRSSLHESETEKSKREAKSFAAFASWLNDLEDSSMYVEEGEIATQERELAKEEIHRTTSLHTEKSTTTHLKYHLSATGERIYTLGKNANNKVTKSAHPTEFSKHSLRSNRLRRWVMKNNVFESVC